MYTYDFLVTSIVRRAHTHARAHGRLIYKRIFFPPRSGYRTRPATKDGTTRAQGGRASERKKKNDGGCRDNWIGPAQECGESTARPELALGIRGTAGFWQCRRVTSWWRRLQRRMVPADLYNDGPPSHAGHRRATGPPASNTRRRTRTKFGGDDSPFNFLARVRNEKPFAPAAEYPIPSKPPTSLTQCVQNSSRLRRH